MQPPGAIISVEVMVEVFITDSNRGFDIFVYFAYEPIIDSLKSRFEHAKQ